jgi:hypothetical protein
MTTTEPFPRGGHLDAYRTSMRLAWFRDPGEIRSCSGCFKLHFPYSKLVTRVLAFKSQYHTLSHLVLPLIL